MTANPPDLDLTLVDAVLAQHTPIPETPYPNLCPACGYVHWPCDTYAALTGLKAAYVELAEAARRAVAMSHLGTNWVYFKGNAVPVLFDESMHALQSTLEGVNRDA